MVQVKPKQKKSRFTLDMSPELRTRLKIAAARKGITMREYSLSAIEDRLKRDELRTATPGHLTREAMADLRALKKRIFGKRRLPDESVEIIRRARRERTKQLERVI